MDNRPIGVFDSGLGGLTVVRQLMRQLPGEKIVYFGDTGRVPYGTRSPETIEKYTRQACRFLIGEDVKMIIAACGTVSSVVPHVLQEISVPAVGVVHPAADAAAAATRNGRIGVLGTTATVRSGSFVRRLEKQRRGVSVIQQACPVFVPLVENGWIDRNDEVTRLTARRYLQPLIEAEVDTVLLGCTHFPLLAPIIGDIMGHGVSLIDSGREAAVECTKMLWKTDSLCENPNSGQPNDAAKTKFYVSDGPENFFKTASMFLGYEIGENINVMSVDNENTTEHLRPASG